MREIKFRAWDKKYKEMREVDALIGSLKGWNCLMSDGECMSFGDYELMQYTGLKDKNGKEIYEGDIVSLADHNGLVELHKGLVKFIPPSFFVCLVNSDQTPLTGEYIVIGNIYEDPVWRIPYNRIIE